MRQHTIGDVAACVATNDDDEVCGVIIVAAAAVAAAALKHHLRKIKKGWQARLTKGREKLGHQAAEVAAVAAASTIV